ncbi:MAG TPA: phage holin family protein [Arthrobacter sp.]|nr:phage holin family protein [Arthrobacter sp.]
MTRTTSGRRPSSFTGLLRLVGRLVPRQLHDEIQLAITQMKTKGIQAGIGAAVALVAVVFLAFMAVALITSGILGLGLVFKPWLAALMVAALFLVIAVILALIGIGKIKKQMPLIPEDAIRGVKYDLGVLKEGRSFDPSTLDEKKPKKDKAAKDQHQDQADKPVPVPYHELLKRSQARREHLAELRDDLAPKLDVKRQAREKTATAKTYARDGKLRARHALHERTHQQPPADAGQLLKDRWQPLAVMGASLVALAAFVRKLSKS